MTQPLRVLVRRIHLWLGLSLGIPFVVLAFTGSALVFYIEIDALLNPEVVVSSDLPAPGWTSPVWDQALATARARWPDADGRWSFEATGKSGTVPARYYASTGHHSDSFLLLWFSPDGSAILRDAYWGDYLMTWFYDVHRNLLAGDMGNALVGWLGVATLFLLITGLAVWWPRGSLQKALTFKHQAAPLRRLYDLHKLSGLASLVLLLVLSATGALLALPAEKNWLLGKTVAPVVPVPTPISTAASGQPISIGDALAAAHAVLPDSRLAWIDVPGPGNGAFRFRVQVPGDPTSRFPHSYIFVDQYSGAVLAVHDVRNGSAASTVNAWLRPLHDASVGGTATRLLGVALGLVPIMLFVTGVLRWVRRRLVRRHRAGAAS